MTFMQVLFSFTGRINRGKYWLAALIYFVVFLVAIGFVLAMIGRNVPDFTSESLGDNLGTLIGALGVGILIFAIVLIPMFVSSLAVGVKRLHDRNKSGWWIVLFYFGGAILDAIGSGSGNEVASYITSSAALVIGVWGFIELGCLRGTVGPNQYGPDPLAPAQGAVAV
jgi:uncharacterized membrane protein YhaH (DUF805 family)